MNNNENLIGKMVTFKANPTKALKGIVRDQWVSAGGNVYVSVLVDTSPYMRRIADVTVVPGD